VDALSVKGAVLGVEKTPVTIHKVEQDDERMAAPTDENRSTALEMKSAPKIQNSD
jgi:hypothetical protein